MSVNGSLVCLDCKVVFDLGKAIFREGEPDKVHFYIGGWAPLDEKRTILDRVLWKMMADHTRHNLRVVMEDELESLLSQGGYLSIGDNFTPSIFYREYLENEIPPRYARRTELN